MRRTLPVLALAALAAGALILALWPAPSPAQRDNDGQAPAARAAEPALPISRAVLFTSGVAYFQRDGEVTGDAAVDLSFPVQDINDLLKSLVLRDRSGGQIAAVGYDSFDPIDKTLKNFAVNLSDNPSFAQILDQTRGEKVEVTWRPPDKPATQVSGTILGVEKHKQPVAKDVAVEVELLNLWSADGMRRLKLTEVAAVRYANAVIDREVKRALDVLARGHDTQKKTVSLAFRGKGKRQVQVGYVVEHPIWKTSYRLVLSEQKKPFLQGWAMVENPTGEDWNNVRVQLVSGRPISFRMDLYQPLYVPRPLVELPQFAGLRPQAYEGAMPGAAKAKGEKEAEEEPERVKVEFKDGKKKGSYRTEGSTIGSPAIPSPPRGPAEQGGPLPDGKGGGVVAIAHGAKLGEAFHYTIDQPVKLARQKSALLPIINDNIEATRVSIYDESAQSTYPLRGLKLKNTTGLHLMQGPITVFEEGSYAGDAIIREIQPKEERLLSYAVDPAVEVKPEAKKEADKLVSVRIRRGILERTYTLRETKTYKVTSRADKDRLLIIQHPNRSPDYKLVKPSRAPHTSRESYRFEVKVPRGESVTFPVVEEREQLNQVALTNIDDDTLATLLKGPAGPELKAAVQKAVALREKLAATQRQTEQVKQKLATISQDQARQRENMKVIPQTEPVYKKYLDKFLAQETQIERLRGEQEQLQVTADRQRLEYERFVANLTVKE